MLKILYIKTQGFYVGIPGSYFAIFQNVLETRKKNLNWHLFLSFTKLFIYNKSGISDEVSPSILTWNS